MNERFTFSLPIPWGGLSNHIGMYSLRQIIELVNLCLVFLSLVVSIDNAYNILYSPSLTNHYILIPNDWNTWSHWTHSLVVALVIGCDILHGSLQEAPSNLAECVLISKDIHDVLVVGAIDQYMVNNGSGGGIGGKREDGPTMEGNTSIASSVGRTQIYKCNARARSCPNWRGGFNLLTWWSRPSMHLWCKYIIKNVVFAILKCLC